MTCDLCTIDPAIYTHVLTRLGPRDCLCAECADRYGIVPRRWPREIPPARAGPADSEARKRERRRP
jgi:hypothetical protein